MGNRDKCSDIDLFIHFHNFIKFVTENEIIGQYNLQKIDQRKDFIIWMLTSVGTESIYKHCVQLGV